MRLEARRRAVGRAGRAARLGAIALVCALGLAAPGRTLAHGDTIRVSYSAVKPARLVVVAGTTVHFHNANSSGSPCTVVIGDDLARSEPLGRAQGWHYKFEKPGEFTFFVEEFSSRKGVVVVTAP